MKLFALKTTKVTLGAREGELLINGKSFARRAPGVYDSEEGARRVFFRQVEPHGDIYLHTNVSTAHRQTSGFDNPMVSSTGLAISLALSLTGFIALAWGRREGLESYARWMSIGMAVCVVLMPILVLAGYERAEDIVFVDFAQGDLVRTDLLILLFNVYFLLGLGVVAASVLAWVRGLYGSGKGAIFIKSHLSVLAIAAIAAWPAMFLFNLIGLQH